MNNDFKAVAQLFKDKRLGTDEIAKDIIKIKHVDEVLKLLLTFTGDLRYKEVIQCEDYGEVDSMCEIMDRAVNKGKALGREEGRVEGQSQLFTLWNWLTASGRNDEVAKIMNPSNEVLRKTLYTEYENSVQNK